jgi:tRNA pseudouridine38-40 synthase
VEVGRGRLGVEAVAELMRTGSEDVARLTAPASGLFLERVYYEGDPRDTPVRSTVTVRRAVG